MTAAPEATVDLSQVAPLVSDELSDWAAAFTQSGVPHPPPSSSDGLPHGWTLVSILPQWTSASHLALAHRNAGGWIIVEHGDNLGLTRLYWIDATLADLYTNAVEEHKKRPSERGLDSMVDWVRSTLLSMFDVDDPREAVERTLFALSGTVSFVPVNAR